MAETCTTSNFDNYIEDLHVHLDHLREISDVDQQRSTLLTNLAQAYSEQPSPMQIGKNIEIENTLITLISFLLKRYISRLYSLVKITF